LLDSLLQEPQSMISWPRASILLLTCLLLTLGATTLAYTGWLVARPEAALPLLLFQPLLLPLTLGGALGGCLLLLSGILGLCAGLHQRRAVTAAWMLLLLLLLITESLGTTAILLYREPALHYLTVFLVEQLRSEFGADNQFTTAVHYVQQKFSCCGVLGPSDYLESKWAPTTGLVVPLTCCVLLNRASPSSWRAPQPESTYDCQAREGGAAFTQGCLPRLSLLLHTTSTRALVALIALVIIQVLGILVSFSLCRRIDRREFFERVS